MVAQFEYATRWRTSISPPRGLRARSGSYLRRAALDVLGLLDRIPAASNAREAPFLRCLYCHYVFDDQVERFERLIVSLKRAATFIDTPTLLAMLEGRQPLDGRYFHLSFDDGFRNHLTNALPILRKHGVPAVFFVPSSLVGADWEATESYCRHKVHHRRAVELLNWDDASRIRDAGYEIGSHTRTHARLAGISHSPAQLEDEIAGSKAEIEQRLGIECRSISWPYGRTGDADATSLRAISAAGFRACFGAFRGTVVPRQTYPLAIPRHHFEVQWPFSHVRFFARGNWERAA
jgi:peptidoglycan/xylan/chitin deacetylase (PgdA/CDA1 family)